MTSLIIGLISPPSQQSLFTWHNNNRFRLSFTFLLLSSTLKTCMFSLIITLVYTLLNNLGGKCPLHSNYFSLHCYHFSPFSQTPMIFLKENYSPLKQMNQSKVFHHDCLYVVFIAQHFQCVQFKHIFYILLLSCIQSVQHVPIEIYFNINNISWYTTLLIYLFIYLFILLLPYD